MQTKVSITYVFNCSLERAFKTPMLCDVTKVHTGFGFTPRVTHCSEDENWGKPGSRKKVHAAKSLFQKGGYVSDDRVITRIENEYWKIEVGNFQSWMFGFTKFVGEWSTKELGLHKTEVKYSYTMHSNNIILYPFNWLFTKLFWRIYMKRVVSNIHQMVLDKEPYLFE